MSADVLSKEAIGVLKATAQDVARRGKDIIRKMYDIMLTNYPQVRNMFNVSHLMMPDEDGYSPQVKSLASFVIAFAQNCDNLAVLSNAIERVTEKHVSFNILPEHYAFVGESLLQAIQDILGDAATEEVLKYWGEAYWFLANLLIQIEERKRQENESQKGGWKGYKELVVVKRVKESSNVTSFYFKHVNGSSAAVPDEFKPGQYLSFRIPKEEAEAEHDMVRNYSLSCVPGEGHFRVSIKRDGIVSNHFHDKIDVGSRVEVGMPCGDFALKCGAVAAARPLVLIAAGIGVTPIMSMLEMICSPLQSDDYKHTKVVFVQCARNEQEHPMKEHVAELAKSNPNLEVHIFYSQPSKGEVNGTGDGSMTFHKGRLDDRSLHDLLPTPAKVNNYYFCGPGSFMDSVLGTLEGLDVPAIQIHHEYFGPTF